VNKQYIAYQDKYWLSVTNLSRIINSKAREYENDYTVAKTYYISHFLDVISLTSQTIPIIKYYTNIYINLGYYRLPFPEELNYFILLLKITSS